MNTITYPYTMPNYAINSNLYMHKTSLNIGSLNCRSLTKPSKPDTSAQFIRYLRSLHLDILCVQKFHAASEVQDQFNMQLQSTSTLWTQHCGIITFNPLLTLHSLEIDVEQRIIACTVVHANALFPLIALVNIYAPVTYTLHSKFYQRLLAIPFSQFTNRNLGDPGFDLSDH